MKEKPSLTAERVAACRAVEMFRPGPERICRDPFARRFISPRESMFLAIQLLRRLTRRDMRFRLPGVVHSILVRTRFIDDLVLDRLANGTTQVVIFGAGYDCRAFRIPGLLDHARVFEIDHPATQDRKKSILRRKFREIPGQVRYIPHDVRDDSFIQQLINNGYRKDKNTLFICEGLTYYLPEQVVGRVLKESADNSLPGSTMVFDFFPESVIQGTAPHPEALVLKNGLSDMGEPLLFGLDENRLSLFLEKLGYSNITSTRCSDHLQKLNIHQPEKRSTSGFFHFVHAEVVSGRFGPTA